MNCRVGRYRFLVDYVSGRISFFMVRIESELLTSVSMENAMLG